MHKSLGLSVFMFMVLVGHAHGAELWLSYGQTALPPGVAVDNPHASSVALGSVSLPYTVPSGKVLVITTWGIEGVQNADSAVALIPWLGPPPATNPMTLPTVTARSQLVSMPLSVWAFPAGSIVNIRLVYTGVQPGWVFGWFLQGCVVGDEMVPPHC